MPRNLRPLFIGLVLAACSSKTASTEAPNASQPGHVGCAAADESKSWVACQNPGVADKCCSSADATPSGDWCPGNCTVDGLDCSCANRTDETVASAFCCEACQRNDEKNQVVCHTCKGQSPSECTDNVVECAQPNLFEGGYLTCDIGDTPVPPVEVEKMSDGAATLRCGDVRFIPTTGTGRGECNRVSDANGVKVTCTDADNSATATCDGCGDTSGSGDCTQG